MTTAQTETETGPTLTLARHYSDLTYDDIPADVTQEAKRLLIDTLGSVISSAKTQPGKMVSRLGALFGAGALQGDDDVLGRAYEIGRLGNLMDFDDSHPTGCHMGCSAIAAALTLARKQRLSGRKLLAAIIVGYELGGQVALAIGPYFKLNNGKVERFLDVWGVATPVVFAAAGAAAHALGLPAALTREAYCLAGSNTPIPVGSRWSAEVDLPNTKYCDSGWCALTGLFSAVSALEGSTGIKSLLDGEHGLIHIVGGGDANSQRFLSRLGERWHTRNVLYKRWPCCRWNQYPLNALDFLMTHFGLSADNVREVVVEFGSRAMSKRFINTQPQTFAALQFSIPHNVAMLLMKVPAGPEWLSAERAETPEVKALRERVKVEAHAKPWSYSDPFAGSEVSRVMHGAVRVTTTDGRTFREERDWIWGDTNRSEGRCDDAAMDAKFRTQVDPATADRLLSHVHRLEQLEDSSPLVEAFYEALASAYQCDESGPRHTV